jgi:acid-sensing ion channel, other
LQFPTVSVCPLDPLNEGNQTYDYDDNHEEYLKLIETLTSETVSEEYQKDNGKSTLRQIMFNLGMLCEDLIYDCNFRGNDISCCSFFKPVYTERGFCFSFNARYIGAANNE